MKAFLWLVITVVLISLAGGNASAQQLDDVVYLKNGGIVRGTIIEQVPGISIKLQTKDGNVFVYQMDEIEKIAKESKMGSASESGPKKNPALAFVLSWILPGVGQFYNGEVGKGVIQLVGAAAGYTAFFVAYPSEEYYSYYNSYTQWWDYGYEETGNGTIAWIGFGVGIGCQLWSMIDAPISAGSINARRGYAYNEIKIKENLALSFLSTEQKKKDTISLVNLKFNF